MSVFRVEKTKNFTVMSNYHLRDTTLSYKARGILSTMLSLPEVWDYTLTGLAKISKDGIASVRAGIIELEKAGYITRTQGRDENGVFGKNIYNVYEIPQPITTAANGTTNNENMPLCENQTTAKAPLCDFPSADNPSTGNPSADNPSAENCTQLNTNILNTDKINIDLLNTGVSNMKYNASSSSSSYVSDEDEENVDTYPVKNTEHSLEANKELVKQNIGYDTLASPEYRNDIGVLNNLVDIIADVITGTNQPLKINGVMVEPDVVKSTMLALNQKDIEYVLFAFSRSTSNIKNVRAYLLTSLFNAKQTIDCYYTAAVKHDMFGGSNF